MSKTPHPDGTLTSARLKSIIERIERLEEEKRGLAADISEIYSEAKGCGFDAKIIRLIVRERQLSEGERAERDALLDIYKAALGMLDGTPLGHAAVERLEKKKAQPELEAKAKKEPEEAQEAEEVPPAPKEITAEDIVAARADGCEAANNGKSVTCNPYPAHDVRRAAFDEGWCSAAGTDGMDIPDAWKPTKKSKKGEGDNNG